MSGTPGIIPGCDVFVVDQHAVVLVRLVVGDQILVVELHQQDSGHVDQGTDRETDQDDAVDPRE